MDPNLMLLYQCIQTVGTKKINFNEVGAALGVNAAAARMRYSRLEAKVKDGRVAKSRCPIRPARFVKSTSSKKVKVAFRGEKRRRYGQLESESATSSDNEQIEPEEERGVNTAKPAVKRSTRGVKASFKITSQHVDDIDTVLDSVDSSDEYHGSTDEESENDSELTDDKESAKPRKNAKLMGNIARSRRSDTPDMTPSRVVTAKNLNASPLTPPSSSTSTVFADTKSKAITPLADIVSYDDQVKQHFSGMRAGVSLPFTGSSSLKSTTTARNKYSSRSPPASLRTQVTASPSYQLEADIMESIERDNPGEVEETSQSNGKDGNQLSERDVSEEDESESEESAHLTDEAVMENPETLVSKKNKASTHGCASQ